MQNRCIVIATLAATYGLWCGGCVDPDHSVSDGLSVNVKPLRYTLRVGQELTYRLEFKDSFFGAESDEPAINAVWKIWIIDQDNQGGKDVAYSLQTTEYGKTSNNVGRFQLSSRGWLKSETSDSDLPVPMTLRMLFPLLPKSEEIRWGEEQLRRGDKWQYILDDRESEGELRVVSATCTGPVERVMDGNMNYTWRFAEQGGRVDTIKMIATWGGYNEKIELTGRLQETKQRTREWLAALQDDMSLYFDVKQRFQGMKGGSVARCAEIQGDGSAGMEPLLNKIGQELRQARQLVSTTVMQKQIDSDLERNAREIKMIESREKRINEFASLIGSPSPDWESTDLEDSPVALRDYRGQVVVLDFWFRECAYCLRMMPQIQQVEKDFADQPVTFLGMSVDDEVEDARFVVQQMDVTQRVVVAQKIHPLYKTTSAPLLVVIGPQGDVRDIFVGYRSTIQEELTEVIREALHDQPPSTISK